jgi:hypothetical protein
MAAMSEIIYDQPEIVGSGMKFIAATRLKIPFQKPRGSDSRIGFFATRIWATD